MNHGELKAKALSDSETLAAYNELEAEFSLLRQMLRAISIANRFSGKRGAFLGFAVKAHRRAIAVSMTRRCNADGEH